MIKLTATINFVSILFYSSTYGIKMCIAACLMPMFKI